MSKYINIFSAILGIALFLGFVIAVDLGLVNLSSESILIDNSTYNILISLNVSNVQVSNVTCDSEVCWYSIIIGNKRYNIKTASYEMFDGKNTSLTDAELKTRIQEIIILKINEYINPDENRTGQVRIVGGVINITNTAVQVVGELG